MNKKILIGIILGIILIISAGIFIYFKYINSPTQTPQSTTVPKGYIDIHGHKTDASFSLEEIVATMDEYSISKMILMQTPVMSDQARERSNPKDFGIPEAAEKYPERLAMMYQGEAFILLSEAVEKNSLAKEEEFKNLLREAAASKKYVGFGELALRHFPQPNVKDASKYKSLDITIPGDHPWMLAAADIAAEYNLALDIHLEPSSETLPGFEALITHNSKTKIIFDHAGWYNTGQASPQLFASLMSKFPNLYASIKLRDPQTAEQESARILDVNNKIVPEWLQVFEKYPDRFMIGTDVKFGQKSSEGDVGAVLSLPEVFLSQLSADLREKIAFRNAEHVFNLK